MKKKTAIGLIGVVAAGVGAAGGMAAASSILYNKCVASAPCVEKTDRWPAQREGREWAKNAVNFRSLTIPAADGLNLWAALVPASAESHRWVICSHGYRETHEAVGVLGKHYAENGWNVLLPDHRGHGQSQGNYVGWGYDERLDLVAWINYIVRRDPEAQIVLHGISMGAAAVLMATGGPLQDHVKAAVSDSSYTNVEQSMRHVMDRRVRKTLSIPSSVPFTLIFSTLRKVTLRRAGYDLKNAAPVEAVAQSKTPTLFIHGGCDETVPPAMMGKLYETARCPKRHLMVENAGHGEAVGADPERYWKTVDEFLKRCMR